VPESGEYLASDFLWYREFAKGGKFTFYFGFRKARYFSFGDFAMSSVLGHCWVSISTPYLSRLMV